MTPRKVLFVCTGNICRSASAEALMRLRLKARGWSHVEVASAGVAACDGDGCPPETLASLRKIGVDARTHKARRLTPALVAWADLILAMTDGHQRAVALRHPGAVGKLHLFKPFAGFAGDVEDPYGGEADEHDLCTEEISRAVDKILDLL